MTVCQQHHQGQPVERLCCYNHYSECIITCKKYKAENTVTSEKSVPVGLRSNLHEVAGHESLADVDVVVPAGEVGARAPQVEPIHDT